MVRFVDCNLEGNRIVVEMDNFLKEVLLSLYYNRWNIEENLKLVV